MYEYMKLLQPVAEVIGTVENCKCGIMNQKYYDHDIVGITGVTNDGRKFELELKVMKKQEGSENGD